MGAVMTASNRVCCRSLSSPEEQTEQNERADTVSSCIIQIKLCGIAYESGYAVQRIAIAKI